MGEFANGCEHGRKNGLVEARGIIQRWLEAYPLDIFPPNPKELNKPIEKQSEYDAFITRASAHMGRHMATRLVEQINECLGLTK